MQSLHYTITSIENLFKPYISVGKPENTLLLLAKCPVLVNNNYLTTISRQNTHLTYLQKFYYLTSYSPFGYFLKNQTILDKRQGTFFESPFSLYSMLKYVVLKEKLACSNFMFFWHSSTLNVGGRRIEKNLFMFYSRLSEIILDLEIL